MKKVLLLITAALLFSGCTTKNDLAMMKMYTDAEIKVAELYSTAAIAKAQSIQATISDDSSDLQRYLAGKSIETVAVQASGLDRPKTIAEAGAELTTQGVQLTKTVITGVGVYKGLSVLEKALSNGGDTNHITTTGDNSGIAYEKSVDNSKRIVTNAGEGSIAYDEGKGAKVSESDELGTCEEKVNDALENYDMNNINLGGLMRRLSADTGCVVEITDNQVMIEGEIPIPSINSHFADHPELSGEPEEPVGTEV